MAFEDLGHEAVKGAAGRRDKLEYFPTIPFFLQRLFHSIDLPSNPPHPVDELLLVSDSVRHQKIKYTPGGYPQSIIDSSASKPKYFDYQKIGLKIAGDHSVKVAALSKLRRSDASRHW